MILGLVATVGLTPDLTGRLLDSKGQPASAEVTLFAGAFDDPKRVASTHTDANGRFRIANPPPRLNGTSQTLLVKTSDGVMTPVGTYAFAEGGTVTLRPRGYFRVQVLSRDHKPIADMALTLEQLSSGGLDRSHLEIPPSMRGMFTVKTDPNGFLRLTNLPAGSEFTLVSADPRYALRIPRIQYVDAKESIATPVYAERAGAIEGRVVRSGDGKPAAGVPIVATQFAWQRRKEAVTDARGRYRITGLTPGSYRVEVGSKSDSKWLAPGIGRVVVLVGGNVTGADLRLVPASAIRGRVTSTPSGKPMEGVNVRVWRPGTVRPYQTFTDRNGRYSVPAIPGTHRISFFFGSERPVTVTKKGAVEDTTFPDPVPFPPYKAPPPRIVKVVGADGTPAKGAELVYATMFGRPIVFVADAEGRIQLPGNLNPPIVLRARRDREGTEKAVTILDQSEVEVRLLPNRLHRIGGRVTDSKGNPIVNAVVTVYEQVGEMGSPVASVATDAEGRWHYDGAWSDAAYSASAFYPGYSSSMTQERQKPEAMPESGLAMPPLVPLTGVASGRVVDHQGKPVPGVEIVSQSGIEAWALTDGMGRFRLEGLEGNAYVVARETHDREAFKSMRPGETDVVFVLPNPKVKAVERPDPTQALVGKVAPEVKPKLWLDDVSRPLASLKGKIVVLDFWGVTCGPCVASLPAVQNLWETFKDRDVLVLGLHDSSGTKEQVAKFAKDKGLTYPIAIDVPVQAGYGFGASFARYGVDAIPRIVILDREGKVSKVAWSVSEAVQHVTSLVLAKNKAD